MENSKNNNTILGLSFLFYVLNRLQFIQRIEHVLNLQSLIERVHKFLKLETP